MANFQVQLLVSGRAISWDAKKVTPQDARLPGKLCGILVVTATGRREKNTHPISSLSVPLFSRLSVEEMIFLHP